MIVIVGDSRVKKLEESLRADQFNMLKPVFLTWPGATLNKILDMLKNYKNTVGGIPEMVVIVGMVGDVLAKERKPGQPYYKVQKNKIQGTEYPAVGGALRRREEVEKEIKCYWPDVCTLWVLPYPVDIARYHRVKTNEELSRSLEKDANLQSLQFNNYLSCLDKTFQKVRDEEVIPWFPIWKAIPAKTYPDEYYEFMNGIRAGRRVPSLYPEATLDGLNPNQHLSQGLWRSIIRKSRGNGNKATGRDFCKVGVREQGSQTDLTYVTNYATGSGGLDVAVQACPEVLDGSVQASPETYDAGTQTDPDRPPLPCNMSVFSQVELPCGHGTIKMLGTGNLLTCEYCGAYFLRENLEADIIVTERLIFREKSP